MDVAINRDQVHVLYKESRDLLEEADKLFKDIEETRKEIEKMKKYRRQKNGRKNKRWY